MLQVFYISVQTHIQNDIQSVNANVSAVIHFLYLLDFKHYSETTMCTNAFVQKTDVRLLKCHAVSQKKAVAPMDRDVVLPITYLK